MSVCARPSLLLRPLRGVHRQRRQRLQHRHADALQLGLALVRREDQRGVDDQVGHAAPSPTFRRMRHAKEQVLLLARAVEGIGAQAALFERGDQRSSQPVSSPVTVALLMAMATVPPYHRCPAGLSSAAMSVSMRGQFG
jgi:hypothetical protein